MLAGVPQPDRRFAKNLQRLRVQADYRPESVDPDDIKDKVAALGRFLKFLGVAGGITGSAVALVLIARRAGERNAFARALPHLLLLAGLAITYYVIFLGTQS